MERLPTTVCVVGLGYVGLPLAESFSRHVRTIGYRRDQKKVDELNKTPGNKIEATTDPAKIKESAIYEGVCWYMNIMKREWMRGSAGT
jgi:UDP-N-acetyl-D-mannosaminuronate dehydrogenase